MKIARNGSMPSVKGPAGLDLVQIAVDVDLEQDGRMVGRSARRGAFETECVQLKLIDEYIDHPHRVVFGM